MLKSDKRWEIFTEKMVEPKMLKFLFISDYHMKENYAGKLKAWYLAREKRDINFVICGGDFDNLREQNLAKEEENIESEGRVTSFLTFLEFFSGHIFYVPGNHDSPNFFFDTKKEREVTTTSHNLHLREMEIAKGLKIMGLGGSIPALKTNFETGQTESVWEGYPYVQDSDLEEDLKKLQNFLDSDKKKEKEASQYIFLSHNGPEISSTTWYTMNCKESLNGGSKNLSKFLMKNTGQNLMLLHGHIHPGQGFRGFQGEESAEKAANSCNKTVVLNPGAFQDGQFAVFTLKKEDVSQKWQIQSTEFYDLNNF